MKEPKTVFATLLSLVVIATAIVSCGRKDQKSTVDSPTPREQTVQKPETVAGPVRKVRLALLDEKRAFDGSPKTKSFDDELRIYGRSLEEELKKLMEDRSSSSEEKSRQIEEFKRKGQKEIEGRKEKMRNEILSDISKATAEVARKKGYILVFERSSLKEGVRRALFVSDESALADTSTQLQALQSEYLSLEDETDEVCKSLGQRNP